MRIVPRNEQDWDFDKYFEYLKTVKHLIPAKAFEFAFNYEHYNLTSHSSLHDAWLEYLVVREPYKGDRKQIRSIEIETCYLGPFHDCRIYINYINVQSYSLQSPQEPLNLPNIDIGHGDLLTHKMKFLENDISEHELTFSRGSIFRIQFKDFEYKIEAYSHE